MERPEGNGTVNAKESGNAVMRAEVLEIESFETAFPVPSEKQGSVMRRFSTLLIDAESGRRYGSNGYVTRAINAFGEEFAVKRLRGIGEGTPTAVRLDAPPSLDTSEERVLRNEFESQLVVADIRGFPRLYGYGFAQGEPLILMEWIEGESLDELIASGVDTATALRIGAELFAVLARLDSVRSHPVHRDISPKNVMLRMPGASQDDRLGSDEIDVCLIDLGSTTARDERDPRFTELTSIMRRGTPEYAPPEMLTDALSDIIELRRSPAIDVYAACSVMYELLAGHTPFRLAERDDARTPYAIKTTERPLPLALDGHEAVGELIMQGLSPDQATRPDASSLYTAFARACGSEPETASGGSSVRETRRGSLLSVPDEGGGHRSVRIASFDHGSEERTDRRALSRRGFIALALGGIAMMGVAGTGIFLTREREGEPKAETDASTPAVATYTGGALYAAQDAETMLWGYLNAQRDWVVSPRFREAPGPFAEGRACVRDAQSGLYGYIEETGEWAIAPEFVQAGTFGDDLAACLTTRWRDDGDDDEARGGWIDRNGDWVIEPVFTGCGPFRNGLAAAKTGLGWDARWGYLDTGGNTVIAESFADAGPFSDDGLARAAARPTRFGWIDRQGKWAIDPAYSQVTSFSEGLAGFMETFTELWGYLDTAGNEVIGLTFSAARRFSAGLAAVQDEASGLWGFIDGTGAWKVPPRFLRAGDFAHGLAPAQDAETALFGYVDDTGEWLIEPRYADVDLDPAE